MPKRSLTPYKTPPPSRRSVARRLSFGRSAGQMARQAAMNLMPNPPLYRALNTARGVYRTLAQPISRTASSVKRTVFRARKKAAAQKGIVLGKKGSHYNSKSAGRFSDKLKKYTAMDAYAEKGFVLKVEHGSVITSTREVTYAAHSTMPQQAVAEALFSALIKKLFNEANIKVKSVDVPLMPDAYYNLTFSLRYKLRDGDSVLEYTTTVTKTTTLVQLANTLVTQFTTWAGTTNLPGQLLTLRLFTQWGVVFDERQLLAELDLTNMQVELASRSHFKIQNRTINSTGNNEADDVDNVPIYGKYFDYKTNGTIYRDYAQPAAGGTSNITTHKYWGVLPSTLASDTLTGMYKELPLPSQFVGCKGVGKSHLDPGEIKTSSLYDSAKFGLQKIIIALFGKNVDIPNAGRFQQIWIGKTRLFGFEKMIAAVATDATSQFNLAVEHQLAIGCIVWAKKSLHTAPRCVQSNATVA